MLLAAYSQPDWTATARYFAPYLPAALLVFWAGIVEATTLLLARISHHTGTTDDSVPLLACPAVQGNGSHSALLDKPAVALYPWFLVIVAFLLTLTSVFDFRERMAKMDVYPGYVLAGKTLLPPAQWMRDHLSQDATVATRRIGALAYFPATRSSTTPTVCPTAMSPGWSRGTAGGSTRPPILRLAELWHRRAPEYLLEDGPIIDYIIAQAGGAREGFSIHGFGYRVVKEFSIGKEGRWVLAERQATDSIGSPASSSVHGACRWLCQCCVEASTGRASGTQPVILNMPEH